MPDEQRLCPICGDPRGGIEEIIGGGFRYRCNDADCLFLQAKPTRREAIDDLDRLHARSKNRRPLEEKNPEWKPIDAILIDNCSCGGTGVLESYRDRLNSDYLLHRVRCERCGLCTHLCTDGVIAQRAWRHLKNDKDAAWARNYFLREAERVGIKNPEQYLKPSPTCDNCRSFAGQKKPWTKDPWGLCRYMGKLYSVNRDFVCKSHEYKEDPDA